MGLEGTTTSGRNLFVGVDYAATANCFNIRSSALDSNIKMVFHSVAGFSDVLQIAWKSQLQAKHDAEWAVTCRFMHG